MGPYAVVGLFLNKARPNRGNPPWRNFQITLVFIDCILLIPFELLTVGRINLNAS